MTGRGNPVPDLPKDIRPCSEITFDLDLIDVDLEVVGDVHVGDRYPIRLVQGRYPAVFVQDRRLGSIASGALSRLVQCLQDEARFDAEILEAAATVVRVRVTPS